MSEKPFKFYPEFSVMFGVKAAVMLSYILHRAPHGEWADISQNDFERLIGMARKEQETARAVLKKYGFLEEKRTGIPAKLFFRATAICQETLERAKGGTT